MRRILSLVGLVTLTALTAVLVAAVLIREPRPVRYTSVAAETTAPTKRPVAALFVGDNYTAATANVATDATFPCLTATAMRWICNVDAQSGTGYVADGTANSPTYRPYGGRLQDTAARYLADYVVVSGGRNDLGKPGLRAAVTSYLRAVRSAYPKARIVVLAPLWHNGDPPEAMVAARAVVREVAEEVGAVHIDTQGWLNGSHTDRNGGFPTAAGHRAMARRLTAALTTPGIRPGANP